MPSSSVAAQTPTVRETTAGGVNHSGLKRPFHLLAYVHLRNIHHSAGAGRVARQLTEQLAKDNAIRLRILADHRDMKRIVPMIGAPWNRFRYRTFHADTSQQQAFWFLLNQPKAESYWPEAEVVYCTGESYVPTRKARLVVTAHDAAYFEHGAHRGARAIWMQRKKWQLLFARLERQADRIHTVSHFSAERLAYFFPALKDRIRVVSNAVTDCFFDSVSMEARDWLERRGWGNRQLVLIPGGLHFRKNADIVLAALPALLERLPDLIVVIAGHCNSDYALRARGISSRIHFAGFVEDEELHALYTSASVVWFPSHYEGFGLPVVEAMASGTAVVASRVSSIPEIAGDAALLAKAHDATDHLEFLIAVLENSTLQNRMIRLGRERARRFTWQSSAEQLKSVFNELI